MTDKIAEIRANHAQSDGNYVELESKWDIHADRAWLLAEVERLREQNKLFRNSLAFVAAYRRLPDPQKNPTAFHMSGVAQEALDGKP